MKVQIMTNPENHLVLVQDIESSQFYHNIGVHIIGKEICNKAKALLQIEAPASEMASVMQNCYFKVHGSIIFDFMRD